MHRVAKVRTDNANIIGDERKQEPTCVGGGVSTGAALASVPWTWSTDVPCDHATLPLEDRPQEKSILATGVELHEGAHGNAIMGAGSWGQAEWLELGGWPSTMWQTPSKWRWAAASSSSELRYRHRLQTTPSEKQWETVRYILQTYCQVTHGDMSCQHERLS